MAIAAIEKALSAAFDIVFPKYCLNCQAEGEWLCADCRTLAAISAKRICPVCKQEAAASCCDGPLSELFMLASYGDVIAKNVIKQLKYGYSKELAETVISGWLKEFYRLHGGSFAKKPLIVPIPLHRQRLLERGFNQSELLARELGKLSGWQVESGLIARIRHNSQQARLSGRRREENVRGIFRVDERKISDCWGGDILLIDDVYTTGSTMQEAARTLKNAGFLKISGLTVAVD